MCTTDCVNLHSYLDKDVQPHNVDVDCIRILIQSQRDGVHYLFVTKVLQ